MKKSIFILMAVILGMTACNDIEQVATSGDDATSLLAVQVNPIQNTVYEEYYDHFMASEHGNLDFSNSSTVVAGGVSALRIPSSVNISTGSTEVPTVPSAVLFAIQTSNGDWVTHVATYNNAEFSNGNITGHIGLSLINDIEYGIINSEGKLLDGEDVDYIPSVPDFDTWWSCTTSCFSDAKAACAGDPACNFICELLDLGGGCTISVAAGCAGHCANQGFKPPTDYGSPVSAPSNDQNCFF